MGVSLKDLIKKEEFEIKDLKNKVVVIDAFNMLYQFLTTIRGMDGNPFTNSKGNVTSHLIGLLSRITYFFEREIKIVFVFDGISPELKAKEREKRQKAKEEAMAKYKIAVKEDDQDAMRRYASRTTKLTSEMIEDAKQLIKAFGIPIVQAPSEGEAQASYMVKKGDAFACLSQDFDSLLFATPLLLRNVSITGKKKKTHGIGTKLIKPEKIILKDVLEELQIDQEQLIILGILVGTDFNNGGIKGIGPKNALKKVIEYKDNYEQLFKDLKWEEFFDYDWKDVYNLFTDMPITDDYELTWDVIDEDKIKEILIHNYEFAEARVLSSLEKISKNKEKRAQKGLGDFFWINF